MTRPPHRQPDVPFGKRRTASRAYSGVHVRPAPGGPPVSLFPRAKLLVLPLGASGALAALAACGPGVEGMEGQCDPEAEQAALLAAAGEAHEGAAVGEADGDPTSCMYFAEDDPGSGAGGEQVSAFLEDPSPRPVTVYLNRHGGTYTEGASSSSENRSPMVPCGVAEIRAYEGHDAAWRDVVDCVREQFADFGVEVTDEEPSSGAYIEVVVGDHPKALGLANKIGGIAPIDTYRCRVLDEAVAFVFSERIGEENTQRICEVVAHEAGHTMGLDHAFLCEDPMTYLKGCGAKVFQNVDTRCGEKDSRDCACGRELQNSVQVLAGNVGMRDGREPPPAVVDEAPPEIDVLEPVGDVSVDEDGGVRVTVEIDDDVSVSQAQLLWDEGGDEVAFPCPSASELFACRREGNRYQWWIRAEAGEPRFRVRAEDAAGHVSVTELRTLAL